ncbi:LIM-type zinc finger-containing protein [Planoprotostelium fungivorum]|nr:LIM-type zinc finger-containing protein [Planoprotostelium fungivorum]
MEEIDRMMSELGLRQEPAQMKRDISENEVDDLLTELGVNAAISPPAPGGRGMSSGPGRGVSSGPGRGISSGPGRGISSGPGRGFSSGPGRGAAAPESAGRSRPLATHTPDGRPIIHTGPPCAHCNEMIIGRVISALGKTYHPQHFVCHHCNKPFVNGQFVEHDGYAYCETDYNQLHCPRCNNCGLPIVDRCISVADHKYHPEHFNCTGCGKNLVGCTFKEDEGDIYCNSCKENRTQRIEAGPKAEICAKCKKLIYGEFVILKGQKMHAEHFRCEECRCEFRGGNCHEYEGKLYCAEDYAKIIRNTCASCGKPILGRSITAVGRMWHPEHFVCFICHEPFPGSNFHEKDGKAYCDAHYLSEFGTPCAKCNKPVIHGAITFLEKTYHTEHFCCSGCDGVLKKGEVMEWESKPMCIKCYDNLPRDLRKKVEKKKEEEKKALKKREKEEKKANK